MLQCITTSLSSIRQNIQLLTNAWNIWQTQTVIQKWKSRVTVLKFCKIHFGLTSQKFVNFKSHTDIHTIPFSTHLHLFHQLKHLLRRQTCNSSSNSFRSFFRLNRFSIRTLQYSTLMNGYQLKHDSRQHTRCTLTHPVTKARFPLPELRPELTAQVDGWPVSITRQHGPSWRTRVSASRVDGPCWRPVNSASGNACPSTRPVDGNGNRSPVNSGSGNRA